MIVGGAQENTLLSLRGLQEKGHEVTLVTGRSRGGEGCLLNTEPAEGIRIIEEPTLVRAVSPVTDFRAWLRLKALFREEKFDIVHTHSSKAGVIGRFAAWGTTPLVIHTIHGQAFHPYQSAWLNRLYIFSEKMAARRCHCICAVAQAMIDQSVTAGIAEPGKYRLVYSGMELEPFLRQPSDSRKRMRRRLGIPENAPAIGKLARLFELKGHNFLIQAATKVVNEFPDARFVLIGGGELEEELRTIVKNKGLNDNFIFTGLIPPRNIPEYLGCLDIMTHFSLREGLPRSVVQAAAAGLPVTAFAIDGTPEALIDGESGFLCPPGDWQAGAENLLKLLRNPKTAREMGEKGRNIVRTRFSCRTMTKTLEDIYENEFSGKL